MFFRLFNHGIGDVVNCNHRGKMYILTIKKRRLTLLGKRYNGEGVLQHKIRVGPGHGLHSADERTAISSGKFPIKLIPDKAFKKRLDDSVKMENRYFEEKIRLKGIKENQIYAINLNVNYLEDFLGRSL